MSVAAPAAPLAWTGERMVPTACDPLTEALHWQRVAYFRPWYAGARVVDAACGEGYGAAYAALFAADVLGIGPDPAATAHAARRYPRARFETADVAAHDYRDADLVVSFGAIEHVADFEAFFRALDGCPGAIVVSAQNGARGWTPEAFAQRVRAAFLHRRVRLLHQEDRWPGLVREGLDPDAAHTIAVIDGGPLPAWPRVGLSMPCCGEAESAAVAATRLSMHYPGELQIALVAQGCDAEATERLRRECAAAPHVVHLVESPRNGGYGQGANLGLDFLRAKEFDFYGVTHDDVIPAPDCLPQLVVAAEAIAAAGHRVGMIGPASNEVDGVQRANVGAYATLPEMHDRALAWAAERHSHVDSVPYVRGLFFLTSPECLDAVGGFDPVFGLGNFEDDDLSLRTRLGSVFKST